MSLVQDVPNEEQGAARAVPARSIAREARFGRLARLSDRVARAETIAGGLLAAAIFALLLLNVATRAAGMPLIWVDELAVYAMVWMAFVGTSLAIRHRGHIAVTLLSDALRPRSRLWLMVLVDLLVLALIGIIAALVWRWFDPVGLAAAGGTADFARTTFNFIYQEPTITLGMMKVWFWLILPIFCLAALLHGTANLLDSIRTLRDGGAA